MAFVGFDLAPLAIQERLIRYVHDIAALGRVVDPRTGRHVDASGYLVAVTLDGRADALADRAARNLDQPDEVDLFVRRTLGDAMPWTPLKFHFATTTLSA